MNWHKILNKTAGLAVLGLLLFAAYSFAELNTPTKGVATLAGLVQIGLPIVVAGFLGVTRWVHRVVVPSVVATPAATPPEDLKAATLDGLRVISARLSRAGRYAEVAKIGAVEKDLGGMFQP